MRQHSIPGRLSLEGLVYRVLPEAGSGARKDGPKAGTGPEADTARLARNLEGVYRLESATSPGLDWEAWLALRALVQNYVAAELQLLDSADEDIARRIRGGDPRAFDTFFSRYGGPLAGARRNAAARDRARALHSGGHGEVEDPSCGAESEGVRGGRSCGPRSRRGTMRSCEEARAALAGRVFGDLDDASEMKLGEHMLGCEACRAEEARLLRLHEHVRGPAVEPGEDLRRRIRAALPRPAPRGLLLRPVPVYVAVVAGLVGALLVVALPHLLRAPAQAPPEPARPAGVPLDPGPPSFTVVQSCETRVQPTPRFAPGEDSARARSRPRSDSL
jgi:hypothetical protein